MRVLLVGATGPSGRQVLARLGGHQVIALVRSASSLPGATIVSGNARSRADLERALTGCDAVISALGSKRVNPRGLQASFLGAVSAAMRTQGVRRLITMAPWGVGGSRGSAPLPLRLAAATFLRAQTADREEGEAAVAASGVDFTHVRSGLLGNGPAKGGVLATADGASIDWRIRRADVAAFLVSQLDDPSWLRSEVVIGYRR